MGEKEGESSQHRQLPGDKGRKQGRRTKGLGNSRGEPFRRKAEGLKPGIGRKKPQENIVNSVNKDDKNVTLNSILYMYINADNLMNKRTELDALIALHNPAVIGIVEVKPKNYRYKIQECEITIPGYDIFHNIEEEEGRGICLHVKQELKPTLVELDSKCQECVFIKCELTKGESLVLGLVYRSPSSSEENNAKLNRTMENIVGTKPTHLAKDRLVPRYINSRRQPPSNQVS